MQFINRAVYFKTGVCIGAGFCAAEREADATEVIALPTDHFDFLGPIKVIGKTKEQIETEAANYK